MRERPREGCRGTSAGKVVFPLPRLRPRPLSKGEGICLAECSSRTNLALKQAAKLEIRNKSECQKIKYSKRCRESLNLRGYLKTDCFWVILILNLFRLQYLSSADFVLRILSPGLPLR
jgi:hypothetical protein